MEVKHTYNNKALTELSDSELATAMREYNITFGPITSSTRSVYRSLLLSRIKRQGSEELSLQKKQNENENAPVCFDSVPLVKSICKADKDDEFMKSSTTVSESEVGNKDNFDSTTFYGVWHPKFANTDNGTVKLPIVFTSRFDAIKAMKAYRGSRFKSFRSRKDAEIFSLSISESCISSGENGTVNSSNGMEPKLTYRCPSFHDLIKFRKSLEENDVEMARTLCYSNPRYLISAGDTPVILQEGSRYNALHVAVKANHVEMCDMLMQTLQDQEFAKLMYPDACLSTLKFRINHLVDLYLNTPERGLCDTPLHIACKFGFVEVVKFLLGFGSHLVFSQNKDQKTCKQVVCARANKSCANAILGLLEEKAYIPLLHHDSTMLPVVGQPILSLSPKALENDRVKAFVGPMSPDQASIMYERWRKSPREKSSTKIVRSDFEKGFERLGRNLARNQNVPWSEYWTFLDCFADLGSPSGLQKLERFLADRARDVAVEHGRERKLMRSSSSEPKSAAAREPLDDSSIKRKLLFDTEADDVAAGGDSLILSVDGLRREADLACSNSESAARLPDDGVPEVAAVVYDKSVCWSSSEEPNRNADNEHEDYLTEPHLDIDLATQSVQFSTSPTHEHRLDSSIAMLSSSLSQRLNVSSPPCTSDAQDSLRAKEYKFYIYGDRPTKADLDAFRALQDVAIDPLRYPWISQWFSVIESYSDHSRSGWPSSESPRFKTATRSILWTA